MWNGKTLSVVLPTYEPFPPSPHPMFLEKRVYQGSSGRVYPLPVTDRIAEARTDRAWDAVYLENEFLRVMVLPEIGGRIHAAQDKVNGYDFIYRLTNLFVDPDAEAPLTKLYADFTDEPTDFGRVTTSVPAMSVSDRQHVLRVLDTK